MFNIGSSQLYLRALIALTALRNQATTLRAGSSSAILLATLAVASADLHAFGNDSRGCAYDRPCFTDIARSTVGGIIVEWNGQDNYSHYNLRWSRPGKESAQIEVSGGTAGNFHLKNAHTGTTYTFSVQGCHKRFAQSSRCSPWESQPFNNKVAGRGPGMRSAR